MKRRGIEERSLVEENIWEEKKREGEYEEEVEWKEGRKDEEIEKRKWWYERNDIRNGVNKKGKLMRNEGWRKRRDWFFRWERKWKLEVWWGEG